MYINLYDILHALKNTKHVKISNLYQELVRIVICVQMNAKREFIQEAERTRQTHKTSNEHFLREIKEYIIRTVSDAYKRGSGLNQVYGRSKTVVYQPCTTKQR